MAAGEASASTGANGRIHGSQMRKTSLFVSAFVDVAVISGESTIIDADVGDVRFSASF